MEKHSFYFKRFSVRHDRSSMKVGTDGVLLGGWVTVDHANRILDIGTGSGIIALMLAQRSRDKATVDAVDVSEQDVHQASENFLFSPWPEKINAYHTRIQEFLPSEKYDLIVCNPPYFINSSPPPDLRRRQARHADLLSFEELLEAARRRLNPAGIFGVVLPVEEGNQLRKLAAAYDLYCVREMRFYSRAGKPQERWFFEFSPSMAPLKTESLVLHGDGSEWSAEYRNLLKGFYLYL